MTRKNKTRLIGYGLAMTLIALGFLVMPEGPMLQRVFAGLGNSIGGIAMYQTVIETGGG